MKLSMDEILAMNAVNQLTKTMPKDCLIEDETITFLVPEKLMGRVIGKKAVNIKELQKNFSKQIELIAFFDEPELLFANALKVNFLKFKKKDSDLIITLSKKSLETIKKNPAKLTKVKEIIKRNFGLNLVTK